MKRLPFRQTALCIVTGMLLAAAQSQAAEDPAALAAELRALETSLSGQTDSHTIGALPPAWEGQTPERRYSVSTSPLRAILASGRKSHNQEARLWLDQIAGQLEGFAAEPSRPPSSERAKL